MEIGPAAKSGGGVAGGKEDRRSCCNECGVARGCDPEPMHKAAPVHWSQNATASAYVGWDGLKIGKDTTSGKGRDRTKTQFALATLKFQNGFTTARITITIIRIVGISLIIL